MVGLLIVQKLRSDRRSTQAERGIPTGPALVDRFATAQFAATIRRWKTPIVVTLAAMVALAAVTADAAPKQSRPAPQPKEATAPRAAGEPIMAIVSIKSQLVTF